MAHHNTVFGSDGFRDMNSKARDHQRGQRLRVMSRWAQFVALGLGQLASRQSLRDIVSSALNPPSSIPGACQRSAARRSRG